MFVGGTIETGSGTELPRDPSLHREVLMKNEPASPVTQQKRYVRPVLILVGSVPLNTMGSNPITEKESVDMMGWD
jgi:hypothetical protein